MQFILTLVESVSVWGGRVPVAKPLVYWGKDIMIIARQTNRAIFMIDFKVVTGWDTTRGKSLYRYFIKPVLWEFF